MEFEKWEFSNKLTEAIKRNGLTCMWCKKICNPFLSPNADAFPTREHIIRKADGGGNEQSNIGIACRKCNSSRHGKEQQQERKDSNSLRRICKSPYFIVE